MWTSHGHRLRTTVVLFLTFLGLMGYMHYSTLTFLYKNVSYNHWSISNSRRIEDNQTLLDGTLNSNKTDIDPVVTLQYETIDVGVIEKQHVEVTDPPDKGRNIKAKPNFRRNQVTDVNRKGLQSSLRGSGSGEDPVRPHDWVRRVDPDFLHKYSTKAAHTNRTQLLHLDPLPFIENLTNPCWLEKLQDFNPYEGFNHLFQLADRRLEQRGFMAMTKIFSERIRGDFPYRMRCLPSFFIIGPQKCGTTDLYEKLTRHPHIVPGLLKEPHWWSRSRIYREHQTTLTEYADLFDKAADTIAEKSLASSAPSTGFPFLTGDATPDLIWDNWLWRKQPEHTGRNLTEVEYITPHHIQAVLPHTKLITIFRNPVERLYSDYLYFGHKWKSTAEDFHTRVEEGIEWLNRCFKTSSRKMCMYDPVGKDMPYGGPWHPVVRLRLGMYSEFLVDWLAVFQREQFKIVSLDDYSRNRSSVLEEIFDFLGVGPAPATLHTSIQAAPVSNTVSKRKYKESGQMLNQTRQLLEDFYRPYNEQLVQLIGNTAFHWDNGS